MAATETGRRKEVGGILEKLRKEGMPASPVPGGMEQPNVMGQSDDPDEPGITPEERKRRLRLQAQSRAAAPAPISPVPVGQVQPLPGAY